jgi:uncharacterized protein
MLKTLSKILVSILFVYVLLCGLLFIFQEKLIFFPEQLEKDYKFSFDQEFEEKYIKTDDNGMLHGLLFKTINPKGLIFYLHGNAGSLSSWGKAAKAYTDLDYDVFMPDYAGYGKSEGNISSQAQLYGDIQSAYNEMTKLYPEEKIKILGYSIGTGPATKIASTNNPGMLILQAPYYSLPDLVENTIPFIPEFLLRYKLETNSYLLDCNMPIVIFHGTNDEEIYYNSSIKLQKSFKSGDTLITLNGLGHNGMTYDPDYTIEIKKILNGEN